MMTSLSNPLLIIVSAPSGAGKTTLCDRLLEDCDNIVYSVSVTTREPRGLEMDGEDYIFVTADGFATRVKEDAFLEHAVVHGFKYGTLRSTVEEAMAEGQSVLMDIDVAGARQIRESLEALPVSDPMRIGFVDLFVAPPSVEALRERLVNRGEDEPDIIERRVVNAEQEMACSGEYMHVVINDDLDRAYDELCMMLKARGEMVGRGET